MNSQSSSILRGVIFAGLFVIPFIPFLVSGSFFFPFITLKAFSFRLIVEIIFATWILLTFIEPTYRPRRSYLLYSIVGFLVVVGLANLFGVAPIKSFWSNFERMEGYVTLLHLGALFLVMSSVFKEVNWKQWWNTSLVASAIMAIYATLQVTGNIDPSQAGTRVDGTFGNTIYLAVYMLFHIFIAGFFLWRTRTSSSARYVYGLLILFQIFVLYHTATRGAILGLIGGLFIVAILNIFNKNESERFVRKFSLALLFALLVFIGGFFALRNSSFVNNNPVLSRFSSLTTEEIRTQGRYFVWPIAFEGWKERPILGWGQENFNYVFNKHYVPEMHHLEPWFDRAHNIFLDWMVAGGTLGLLSYLALYFSLLYLVWRRPSDLSYTEKTIITGLVAAYFFHNFFVFDHLFSYILFFSLLAYIHSKSTSPNVGEIHSSNLNLQYNVALPVVVVVFLSIIYFVNIQPMKGNTNLLGALRALQDPSVGAVEGSERFRKAYRASRLGRPEVVEHMIIQSAPILTSQATSIEEKNEFFSFTRDAVLKEVKAFEDDARTQLLAGSFFSDTGQIDEALIYLNRARELMPGKQAIYVELANAHLLKGDIEEAIEILLTLAEVSPQHQEEVERYIRAIQEGSLRD